MAGHSHWAKIQHKKAAIDRKRGKAFSKLARKVIVAAKVGGGDPDTNLRLKIAVADARAANMTNDQIHRAIQRAVGNLNQDAYEDVLYEGYGAGGAAVLVEALTDNRNRTGGEVRGLFEKWHGKLGSPGSVAWQFQRKAVVRVPATSTTEEQLMVAVLDAGAEDIENLGDAYEVRGPVESLQTIQQAVAAAGLEAASAQIGYVPTTYNAVDGDDARRITTLLEMLEENDDVQNVHTNAEFPDGFEG